MNKPVDTFIQNAGKSNQKAIEFINAKPKGALDISKHVTAVVIVIAVIGFCYMFKGG